MDIFEKVRNESLRVSFQEDLMDSIEEFYLPRHLVNAIYEIGHIPEHSREGQVGVGFIDIADYTRLSKYLSPKENQILLNGLYTAFQIVLERHGGYLNKIEGDSMMFHFDDIIDKRLWDLDKANRETLIARELFYTCVDMQRVCVLFNQADEEFLEGTDSQASRNALVSAFNIIRELRNKTDISSTLFAFFQIHIRIGANIGEVTIGNFGPEGSKHWDVIGLPVINAKRMESTAPVGGLRISEEFFNILKETGIADDYFKQFREEADILGSVYRTIKWDDLFRFREVVLHEKRNASYKTYSVQVYPALPESLARQAMELLNHGEAGVKQILEFFRYYRGNHYILDALQHGLEQRGVVFRLASLLESVSAKMAAAHKKTGSPVTIFKILNYMDQFLDKLRQQCRMPDRPDFFSYDQYMNRMNEYAQEVFDSRKKQAVRGFWYTDVVVQLVYAGIEASLLEYQMNDAEELETL